MFVVRHRWENDRKVKFEKELTFRQLSEECAFGGGMMALWDSLKSHQRLSNQVSNDPDYKPIKPNAGYRRYRRWRG